MRWMRGTVNAMLMVTLVKPLARRMVARWRRRARESAVTTIGIPVQELLETALIEELGAPVADLQPSPAETSEQLAGQGVIRIVLIAGVAVAVTTGVTVAIAALIRRRREAQAARAEGSEWVAIPVDASIEEAEEAVTQGTLVE